MGNWKIWIFVIAAFFLIRQCGGCGGNDDAQDGESSEYEQTSKTPKLLNSVADAPFWIQGKWVCTTPYGRMTVEISGNHIKEFDGTSYYEGTYHIQDDMIMTDNTGSNAYYKMDFANKRLAAGGGYYFTKR